MVNLASHYREKHKRTFKKRFYYFLGSIAVFIFLLIVFFWLPFFRISKISVEGGDNEAEANEAVKPLLGGLTFGILPGNNYFLFSEENIVKVLLKDGFGMVEVRKIFSQSLNIKFIKGGEPWLIFCKAQSDCYYVDQKGILSERAPQFSQSPLPIFSASSTSQINLGEQVLNGTNLNFILIATRRLESLNIQINNIELGENNQIKIYTKEGWWIELLSGLSAVKVFDNLSALLDQKIKSQRPTLDYIDLRFENKAFYKFK